MYPSLALILVFSRLSGTSFIKVNNGITVIKGQVGYLLEHDLQFSIPKEKDACKVEVIVNEPITQRVGKLFPQVRATRNFHFNLKTCIHCYSVTGGLIKMLIMQMLLSLKLHI